MSTWFAGTTRDITWQDFADTSSVKIELSRNDGTAWSTLDTGVANNDTFDYINTYPWVVTGPSSSQCKFQITSEQIPEDYATSSLFEISTDSKNYFSASSAAQGVSIISTIDGTALIEAIQSHYADTYFDATSKLSRVIVYYTQESGRQVKKIVHKGSPLTGTVSWGPYSLDGTWEKSRISVFDPDGATHELPRYYIGTAEDIVQVDGTMFFNV